MFVKTRSTNARAIIFVAVSIVMMLVDHRYGHLKFIRSTLSTLVYPIQYVVNLPIEAADWISTSLNTRSRLLEENATLKEQHLLLSSKLQRFEILESENKRLRELLESSFRLNEKVLVAEIMGVESQSFRQQIIINKGTRNQAYDGQPIVDAAGIMGQILHTSQANSTVLLITDVTHALPIQINRNGLRAIAVGTGLNDSLELQNLPQNADIKVGDLVISSGLGGRFPSGYPVGVVEEITLDPGEAFAKIKVKTSSRMSQSREVLMVWPNNYSTQIDDEVNDS